VVDEPHGLIVGIEPSTFAIDDSGIATVDATVTLRGTLPPQRTDQIIPIELVVAAEGKVAVAEERWWVVVPGTGLD
jgi:hypothetical protein